MASHSGATLTFCSATSQVYTEHRVTCQWILQQGRDSIHRHQLTLPPPLASSPSLVCPAESLMSVPAHTRTAWLSCLCQLSLHRVPSQWILQQGRHSMHMHQLPLPSPETGAPNLICPAAFTISVPSHTCYAPSCLSLRPIYVPIILLRTACAV